MGRSLYRKTFIRQSSAFRKLKFVYGFFLPGISLSFVFGCTSPKISADISNSREEGLTSLVRPIEGVAALGQIVPSGDIRRLAAPVSGFGGTPRVASLHVDEGDIVKKGQILAVFDNRPQVLSDLLVLKARLETLNIKLLMQEREIARYRTSALEGATSLVLLEDKEDELIKIKGQIRENKAEKQGLEADLSNTVLKTPIDGIVLIIHTRVGERSDNKGILEVGSNKIMHALIEVYESDINRVKHNQKVTLISENGGFDGNLSGYVERISPQVRQRKVLSTDPTGDADARIVEVRVTLDTTSSALVSNLTGMKVIAKFKPL